MTMRSKLIVVVVAFGVLITALVAYSLLSGGPPAGAVKAGFDTEFLDRPDGYPGLQKAYNFEFAERPMHLDPGLMYKAVHEKQVDVICAFMTDGRIEAFDLKVLDDDRGFFPPYDAAPLVRAETLEKHPQLREVLNRLGGKISTARMRKLNYAHDRQEDSKSHRQIAHDFLVDEGLIDPDKKGDGSAGTITVGGKNFTEQDIIGEMMAILIEHNTNIKVERKLGLGGTMLCFKPLQNGDLDLYAEYTGTGLMNILDRPVIKDSREAYDTVAREFKDRWDLIWLKPFGFNNAYTITMRREHAERLGVETISDLAAHVRAGAGGPAGK